MTRCSVGIVTTRPRSRSTAAAPRWDARLLFDVLVLLLRVGLLDEAEGRVENKIAKAAVNAIASLSQDRDDEVVVETEAIVEDDVSKRNDRRVAKTIAKNVDGQGRASEKLAELIRAVDARQPPDAAKRPARGDAGPAQPDPRALAPPNSRISKQDAAPRGGVFALAPRAVATRQAR